MAFDFPNAPTTGQVFNNYTWDGEKWAILSVYNPVDVGAVRFDKAQGLTANQMSQGRANIDVTKKNYIINGAMMVSQENGTTAGTTPAFYPADMFGLSISGTTAVVSIQQQQIGTPGGSSHRIRATVTTPDVTQDANDFAAFQTAVEGNRYVDLWQPTPKQITLRFGVKAPAGTYCVAFRNFNTTKSYVAEYIIAAGEANTDVVKTITLPATDGTTFDFGVAAGVYITWAFICGSTFRTTPNVWATGNFMGSANQFNFMGTGGNVFELFDVSLTEGTVAPPFQVPDYATELAACMRFWEKGVCDGAYGISSSANLIGSHVSFVAAKRANPTMTVIGSFNGGANGAVDAAWVTDTKGFAPTKTATVGAAGQAGTIFNSSFIANARL